MKFDTHFENMSFHDAYLEKISRDDSTVKIDIAGVFISNEHPQSNQKDWLVESCTLELFGVKKEEAKYWDDDKAPKAHPDPNTPLDEIMHANYENGVFHFDGFKESEAWYEWFISAEGFKLNVIRATEQKS